MGISRKTPTSKVVYSSSLRAETDDQSCELNVRCVRPYLEKVFPSPVKSINCFLERKKGKKFAISINLF